MRLNWPLLVAWRHFLTRRREKGHTAVLLSIGGIASGVMTLIAVLAVMNGFQLSMIEDILEIESYHLRVEGLDRASLTLGVDRLLEEIQGVDAVLPFYEEQVLISGLFGRPVGAQIRALPSDFMQRDSQFAAQLQLRDGSLDLRQTNSVIIGSGLASQLGVGVGQSLSVLTLGDGLLDRSNRTELTVAGLFHSGFLEYDRNRLYTSIDSAQTLFGAEDRLVWGIKLANRYADFQALEAVRQALDRIDLPAGRIVTWREFNRAIFGALRLEKILMILVVGLIFVVVAINIFQSLRRSVIERTEEIALLRALGATPHEVQRVFVLEGASIGLAGGIIGMLLGLLVAGNVNQLFAITEALANMVVAVVNFLATQLRGDEPLFRIDLLSPIYFYISEVPSQPLLTESIGVFLFGLISAAVAAYAASWHITTIRPAETLRNE